jgi:uroporphyrinogen decarboxylase
MFSWLESLRSSDKKKVIPVISSPGARLIGTSIGKLVRDSSLQTECIAAVVKRIDPAAAVSLMDLSVEAECFGSRTEFMENEVPSVKGALVSSAADAHKLKIPDLTGGRAGVYLDTLKKVKDRIDDRPVLAGVIGPFSLAGRLVDVTMAMIYCFDEPEILQTVTEKCTEFLIKYILEYKKAGADGILMAEPLAGLLSPAMESEFSAPYIRKIVNAVQDENFIIVYHNCGGGVMGMTESISSNGCKACHFGNAVDISKMLEKMPEDIIVMGNLDPVGQLSNGTPESVREATLNLLEKCGKYPNYVVSSGCDVPFSAKWENIDAFISAVKEYNLNK